MTDYRDENIWLMQGNCLERMKEIPEGSVDAIITDPPYGTTACAWDSIIPFDLMWEQLKRVIKPNGAIVLFGSQPFTTTLIASNMEMFKFCWVWDKQRSGSATLAKVRPNIITEDICVFSEGRCTYYPIMEKALAKNMRPRNRAYKAGHTSNQASGVSRISEQHNECMRYPKNLISLSAGSKECNNIHRVHPTQKPVALMEYLIKTYTNEGDTVLDFTMGSGTTGVAASTTGREFIGIELDEEYFDISKRRILEASGQEPEPDLNAEPPDLGILEMFLGKDDTV